MEASVTRLRPARQTTPRSLQAKTHTRGHLKRLQRQRLAAAAVGTVACGLTALSLSHLAHGIEIATGTPGWGSWAMAGGIDLGFIGLEFAQITATTETLHRAVSRFTRPAIAGTLAGSAAMNAFAFAEHATGWMTLAAVVMGVAVPGMIYALMRVGTALHIDAGR